MISYRPCIPTLFSISWVSCIMRVFQLSFICELNVYINQSHIQMVPSRLHPVPPTFCCDLLDSFFQGLTESAPSVDRMWYYLFEYLFVSGMAAMPWCVLSFLNRIDFYLYNGVQALFCHKLPIKF